MNIFLNYKKGLSVYQPAVVFSSSRGWVILVSIAVMLSSIVTVMFSLPVIFWANTGVVIAAMPNVATITISTNNAMLIRE